MNKAPYTVTFWGVRGSLPVPGSQTLHFGGNTPCIEIQIGSRLLIIDAGSGIYNLGQKLIANGSPLRGDILISHTHWDHIQGFPFFAPAFVPANRFILYGQSKLNRTFADLMKRQMMPPHFPIPLHEMGAQIDFQEIAPGDVLDLGDEITITTARTNHPDECLAFRVDHGGRSTCYVTDTEHFPQVDPELTRLVAGADLVIYDSNYTDDEYTGRKGTSKIGWGHSTWQEGIKLVQAAGAKRLILFHHAIHRSDDELKQIEAMAQDIYPNCTAAWEGMEIPL
ncbi:MBL fold metallo-hydrolase [Heliobacterium chlorum]|uniref:MBL fold metallo-hydrolase n=1 Tax=Heliobacterium chlorum TaxID=2698 RepID=A0ABR7SX09_HELCL|nr:MBL fold metallo-hydrolase [Heliobacterium chlorum]